MFKFKSIAKFFGRHTNQEVASNPVAELSAQEKTNIANAPFFRPSTIAEDFAMELDSCSHTHHYNTFTHTISKIVNDQKAYRKPASHFTYSFDVAEMPPKSVLAQLIVDGFQVEYRDHKIHITLPTSKIESEADKILENFTAQMEAAKAKEEEEDAKLEAEQNPSNDEKNSAHNNLPASA